MEKKTLPELRKEASLTQKELAVLVDLTSGAIGMYETGKRKPSLELAIRIAQVFDISVEKITFTK